MTELELLEKKLRREIKARSEAESLLETLSEELYLSAKHIEKTETKLQYALDNIIDGIIVLDKNLDVTLVNKQFNDIYFQKNGTIKKSENAKQKLSNILDNEMFPSLESVHKTSSFEIQTTSDCWILCKVNKTNEGVWIILIHDITWRKRAELEKSDLSRKLYQSQKQEAIGRMASVIAHDFNNILGAINGFATFLAEDLNKDTDLYTFSKKILLAVDRGKKIIQNLSDFNYQTVEAQSSISILEVLEESIEIVQNTIKNTINTHIPDYINQINISGNKTQLIRLFTNLLTNSRDACNSDSSDISIKVNIHQAYIPNTQELSNSIFPKIRKACSTSAGIAQFPTGCITVSIQDNGCGMSQETLDKAFEPYFTTKDKGSGTGLGMYSVFETISSHEANITIISTPNLGTYCEMSFPINSNELQYFSTNNKNSSHKNSNKIILIDDDKNHLEYLSTLLTRKGFTTSCYASSHQGLKALLKNPNNWGCVISDYMMPGLKGTDILQQIRMKNSTIPFILCTGYITSEKVKVLKSEENVTLLEKPIDPGKLLQLLEQLD